MLRRFLRFRVLLFALLSLQACRQPAAQTPFALTDPTTGIHIEISQQDSLPALKILLPGQPASDPGILVLFPEHVTALERGKSEAVHLYVFRPGLEAARPVWRIGGQSFEYEMNLSKPSPILACLLRTSAMCASNAPMSIIRMVSTFLPRKLPPASPCRSQNGSPTAIAFHTYGPSIAIA